MFRLILLLLLTSTCAAVRSRAENLDPETTVRLDPLTVQPEADDGFDHTGLSSHEQQLRDFPFANALVVTETVEDEIALDQLNQIASPSAVDLATGDSRLNLRGFPTPLLRNGFVTMGASDMLNTSRTVIIQGALVPVLGRAAPGGIQDFWTARPRTSPGRRLEYSLSSEQAQTAAAEVVGTVKPKRGWHRVALNWSRREGPEEFATNETITANAAVAWKHGKKASTLWSVDVQEVHANAAPAIPDYRVATGQKIVGPYLPLAGFNVFGPNAGVRRRTAAATAWFDAQPHPRLNVRAGFEAWWRSIEQDRFTTGVLNLATQRFEGTREPRHLEQPQNVFLAHLETTVRFSFARTEHKVMGALSQTWGVYRREERALPTSDRNQLPASVRFFDPADPDFSRPAYSPELYSRILTDRDERARYTALELTERVALHQGRTVLAAGLRQDFVALDLTDRRPGAAWPRTADAVEQLTYHGAINHQVRPNRLLVFATISTAFDPSTRVDVRTGRIQGNDTTRGYETGFKARSQAGELTLSGSAFLLFNQNISRRNPLYDDPIFDANQTQPQLVAAGEERFTGTKWEGRWDPAGPWTISGKVAYTEAITTASPDIPQEVGRPMTRLPPCTGSVTASYAWTQGIRRGLTLSGTWSYVSSYVAHYEDRQRYGLSFPGYGLLTVSSNWSVKRKKVTHVIGLAVRNALDADVLRSQARLGNRRQYVGNYRVTF